MYARVSDMHWTQNCVVDPQNSDISIDIDSAGTPLTYPTEASHRCPTIPTRALPRLLLAAQFKRSYHIQAKSRSMYPYRCSALHSLPVIHELFALAQPIPLEVDVQRGGYRVFEDSLVLYY